MSAIYVQLPHEQFAVAREFSGPSDLQYRKITLAQLTKEVCEQYNINVIQIRNPCRERRFLVPRQIAMYLAYKYREKGWITLKIIGQYFGGRDHTTVINSRDIVKDQMKIYPQFHDEVVGVYEMIRGAYGTIKVRR